MATRGRKPKPTALRVIEGNPGKRQINRSEPKPTGGTSPPAILNAAARAEWRRLEKVLKPLGMLTPADRVPLALFCQNWADYCELVLAIRDVTEATKREVAEIRAKFEKAADQARAAGIDLPDMIAGLPAVPRLAGLLAVGKDGVVKTHPFVAQRNAAVRMLISLSGEFGFTPSARTRLNAPTEKPKSRLQESRERAREDARKRAQQRIAAGTAMKPEPADE